MTGFIVVGAIAAGFVGFVFLISKVMDRTRPSRRSDGDDGGFFSWGGNGGGDAGCGGDGGGGGCD